MLLLSVDAARWLQPIRVALPRVGRADLRGDAAAFERAFAEYGLPERIRSDNGGPFASTGLGGCRGCRSGGCAWGSSRSALRSGIPSKMGRTSNFIRCSKPTRRGRRRAHARAQQRRFTRFCAEYNDERPHEALARRRAGELLSALAAIAAAAAAAARVSRPFRGPARLDHRPSRLGRRAAVSLSGALAGEDVAFEEVDDGLWTIHFATVALGRFDDASSPDSSDCPVTGGAPPAALAPRLT